MTSSPSFKRVRPALFASLFLWLVPYAVHAGPADAALPASSVVYVKMENQGAEGMWRKMDTSLQEELAQVHLEVDIVTDNGDHEQDAEPLLQEAAAFHGAAAAFRLEKVMKRKFRLSLYVAEQGARPAFYKEILFQVPPDIRSEEVAHIVTLKAAEAVYAAVTVETPNETGPEPPQVVIIIKPLEVEPSPPPPSVKKSKRWAIASLVSGIAIVGLGGVFHYQMIANGKDANTIREWALSGEEPRYTDDYEKEIERWKDLDAKHKAYRGGAIAAYAVGGALTVTGIITLGLVAMRNNRNQEHESYAVTLTENGVTVTF